MRQRRSQRRKFGKSVRRRSKRERLTHLEATHPKTVEEEAVAVAVIVIAAVREVDMPVVDVAVIVRVDVPVSEGVGALLTLVLELGLTLGVGTSGRQEMSVTVPSAPATPDAPPPCSVAEESTSCGKVRLT